MKTTYYVASSLDGFIAESDGAVDFLDIIGAEPNTDAYDQFFAGVDALLMGRRTYDQVLGFGEWPYGDRPCWVMTHRELDPNSATVGAIAGTPQQVHGQIAARSYQHLWLVGGANLAAQFLHQGLIDQIVVSLLPIVLGQGIPLFSNLPDQVLLSLNDVTARDCGIVELTYVLAGAVENQ
ncbi:MAG: dihydrofolate reductase family protein [Cyanobacteria bacterium P01_F01_bin.150]